MLDGDWAARQLRGSWFRETRGGAFGPELRGSWFRETRGGAFGPELRGSWFRETRGGAYGPETAIGKAQTTDSNIATGIAVIAPFDYVAILFRS
jgi:hypothetical protein